MLLDYIGSLDSETDEQIIERFEQAKADSANSWILDGKGIHDEAHLTDIPYTNIEWYIATQAAKHQKSEPVYPTWYEFMRENKIIPDVLEDRGDYYKTIGKWLVKTTIKHDIA